MNTQDSEYEMLYEALAGEPPRRGRGIPQPWYKAWEELQATLSPVAHRLQLVLDPDYVFWRNSWRVRNRRFGDGNVGRRIESWGLNCNGVQYV